MKQIELLAPAGSMDAAVAAVRSGANAIYMGFGDFNARRNAKNFTKEEMVEICDYCRARGVKTHITLNTLLNDREFNTLESTISDLCEIAPDAVIVADLGVAKALREAAPHLCLHASTQLTVHNVEGAKAAKELGFSRVVLSRELSCDAIREITKAVDIETEIFVHGALCMCYSGQCYMSGFIGRRSGNRGLCAQPCRLPYRINGAKNETYPLSLKDLCLADFLSEIRELGVSSLKIEGRMKRPEYVATVCDIYSRLLRENRHPTKDEMASLREIFSRDGFTEGYFTHKKGSHMFGTRDTEPSDSAIYKEARKLYAGENPLIKVNFHCEIKKGEPISLTVTDEDGSSFTASGISAEAAITRPLGSSTVEDKLSKTGGTPFFVGEISLTLEEGVSVPVSAINALRRDALDGILELRKTCFKAASSPLALLASCANIKDPPTVAVSLFSSSQLSDELSRLPLERIYLPVSEFADRSYPENLGLSLPQIIWDDEWHEIKETLNLAKKKGIKHILVSNISQIAPLLSEGFILEGDMGLNILNSRSLCEYKNLGLERATLSPELMLSQARDVQKHLPCDLIAYGRLPLMITENCAVSSGGKCPGHGVHTLTDRRGFDLPVLCLPRHRNMILNPDLLYLADKYSELKSIGISRLRLLFTLEDSKEVVKIAKEYLNHEGVPPQKFTRGLYFRGVE